MYPSGRTSRDDGGGGGGVGVFGGLTQRYRDPANSQQVSSSSIGVFLSEFSAGGLMTEAVFSVPVNKQLKAQQMVVKETI